MKKKWWVLDVLILVVGILFLFWVVWNFSLNDSDDFSEECVVVHTLSSFTYDACYDAYSKNIFLEMKRGGDRYEINAVKFSFFDISEESYELTEIPMVSGSMAYKIPAEKNPDNIAVEFDIVKDFSAPVCSDPRRLFVKYCTDRTGENDVNVSVSPLGGVEMNEFVEVEVEDSDSDVFTMDLVDKESIWKAQCDSSWNCNEWGECVDGVQRRDCEDVNDCSIPIDAPMSVRYCDDFCSENWQCEWSSCQGGFTVPACVDLNDCGTSYNIPKKLECGGSDNCIPDIECGFWSSCEVDYNFMDLISSGIDSLEGVKFRICEDVNDCADSREEERPCSIKVDIYTSRFVKCGKNFIGVYNRLNGDLIARIEEGSGENPYLNINLDDNVDRDYCDYCYDGVLDGDEEKVDCGGSCEDCSIKYGATNYKEDGWVERLKDWIFS